MDAQALALLPLWYAAFLLSITCHEAAHGLLARLGGDDTAYLSGQVSLNPWPHIRREPIGTVLVPLLTYFAGTPHWMMGWASAPYDPRWEARHPGRSALMSAAGPAANFLLFVVAFCTLRLGLQTGFWEVPQGDALAIDRLVTAVPGTMALAEPLGRFFSVVLGLNLILGLFNLIPVPPLDGASVLAGIASPLRSFYQSMRAVPAMTFVGLIVAWRIAPYIVGPVLRAAVHALFAG